MQRPLKDAPVRVVVVGLGPIGQEVARACVDRPDLELVGAVDVAPALAGTALRKLVSNAPKTLTIDSTLLAGLDRGADAVALCTSSRLKKVAGDLDAAIERRVHVASTCEELSAPCVDAVSWARLDARAREQGVTVLGTGVNPGFVMDRLVLAAAGACVRVDRVKVERIVDVAKRRKPLQEKVGVGLTSAEFHAGVDAGTVGHVGLRESATLVAHGLGWKIERYHEKISPFVKPDGICEGLIQVASAWVDGVERISFDLQMVMNAVNPRDHILLDADPPIDLTIYNGTQGERGTVGAMCNALAALPRAPRGLVTVVDVFS